MPWPNAQDFREDHNQLIAMRIKYNAYFKQLYENDPYRISVLTVHCQDIGYALDRLIWLHADFENYMSER